MASDSSAVRLIRGEMRISVSLDDLEVRKIAAVFKLQPASLYLVKEFENVVVFPHEQSGCFNTTQVDSSYTYEVHGDEVSDPGTPSHAVVSKPFGAYTGPSYHSASSPSLSVSIPRQPTPFSAAGRRKSTFRKTIALVSLTADTERPCSSKSSGRVSYTVVTQVVVTIDCNNCSPSVVTELVKQQVGYDVILLDSKCYPVLDNDTSRSVDYWKSSRKILAASKPLYTTLKGTSADPERAKVHIDLTDETERAPPPKRACFSKSVEIIDNERLEKIERSLDTVESTVVSLDSRLSFIATLVDTFECVICKSTAEKPVTASCCCRLIGCEKCVFQWVRTNSTCPHCSSEATPCAFMELKGLEHVLSAASLPMKVRPTNSVHEANSPRTLRAPYCSSDDSDFES